MDISDLIPPIPPLDDAAMRAARDRQQTLTKPLGSLGHLETLSIHLAGITATPRPRFAHKAVVIMSADHGVATESVSAYPQEVTAQMVQNFLRRGAAINVLARMVAARVLIVDIGVASDIPPADGLLNRKIAYGTANMAKGAAMTPDQASQAIRTGIEVVAQEATRGLDMLALGDMGIGNTTAAAAIACALMGAAPADIVGRGTGVGETRLAHKIATVTQTLALHRPASTDALEVLATVGGLEIGGLVGLILGAAARRIPVVVDGFVTTAAAMLAVTLAPQVKPYLIASHRSQEQGHAQILAWLGLPPLFDYAMRLGEGSGAVLAMHTLEAAARLLDEMATFTEAGVSTDL
jgi:nicotinate-nucleotide--dimethylbenzimidazole phosphoribosyltransferase